VDVTLLLVAPVAGVGRAGLGVARVAAHLHDDARHLGVVRHADVALPVDPEAVGAGAVRMAGVDDVVPVDFDVTRGAGRLGDAAARGHDRVVVGPVAVGAGELLLRQRDARVLTAGHAHRAGLELLDDLRVVLAVAPGARGRVEVAAGQLVAEPRRGRRRLTEVVVDGARLLVRDQFRVERRHDAARVAELAEELVERDAQPRERRADHAAAARAMAPEASPGRVQDVAPRPPVVSPDVLRGGRRGGPRQWQDDGHRDHTDPGLGDAEPAAISGHGFTACGCYDDGDPRCRREPAGPRGCTAADRPGGTQGVFLPEGLPRGPALELAAPCLELAADPRAVGEPAGWGGRRGESAVAPDERGRERGPECRNRGNRVN